MASIQTFFRTVVMLATLGLLAKAWYLYGPTVGEMQAIGFRVAELAQQAWESYWQAPGASSSLADDQSRHAPSAGAPAPFMPPGGTLQPIPQPPPAELNPFPSGPVQLAAVAPAAAPLLTASTPVAPASTPTLEPMPSAAPQEDDRLPALLERLQGYGVCDQELRPWGSRGELMRFSCSAPWAMSPGYTRHFEAVAATPLAAVEQVAAEIEAWRRSQQRPVEWPR